MLETLIDNWPTLLFWTLSFFGLRYAVAAVRAFKMRRRYEFRLIDFWVLEGHSASARTLAAMSALALAWPGWLLGTAGVEKCTAALRERDPVCAGFLSPAQLERLTGDAWTPGMPNGFGSGCYARWGGPVRADGEVEMVSLSVGRSLGSPEFTLDLLEGRGYAVEPIALGDWALLAIPQPTAGEPAPELSGDDMAGILGKPELGEFFHALAGLTVENPAQVVITHCGMAIEVSVTGKSTPRHLQAIAQLLKPAVGQICHYASPWPEALVQRETYRGPTMAELLAPTGERARAKEELALNEAAEWETMGKAPEALAALRRAWGLKGARLGEDHLEVAELRARVAEAVRREGRPEEARRYAELSLATYVANGLPEDEPRRVAALRTLADAAGDLGDVAQDVALHEQLLPLERKLHPTSAQTAAAVYNLALAYRDAGQLERSIPLFEEGKALAVKVHGPESHQAIYTTGALGNAYFLAGRIAEARREAELSIGTADRTGRQSTHGMLTLMVEIAQKQKRPEETRKWLARAEAEKPQR